MVDLTSLRLACLFIAINALWLMVYSGKNLKPEVDRGEQQASLPEKGEFKGFMICFIYLFIYLCIFSLKLPCAVTGFILKMRVLAFLAK